MKTFQQVRIDYTGKIPQYPSHNFEQNYVKTQIENFVGTKQQIAEEEEKLTQEAIKIKKDIISEIEIHEQTILNTFLKGFDEYPNPEKAKKFFNTLVSSMRISYDDALIYMNDFEEFFI